SSSAGRAQASINPRLRLDILHLVRQRIFVDRAGFEADAAALAAPAVEPGGGVLHPVLVVAVGIILASVGAAAFLAVDRAGDGDAGLGDQVVEFQRLDQIGVPDQAAVGDADIVHPLVGFGELVHALDQHVLGAEHGAV